MRSVKFRKLLNLMALFVLLYAVVAPCKQLPNVCARHIATIANPTFSIMYKCRHTEFVSLQYKYVGKVNYTLILKAPAPTAKKKIALNRAIIADAISGHFQFSSLNQNAKELSKNAGTAKSNKNIPQYREISYSSASCQFPVTAR